MSNNLDHSAEEIQRLTSPAVEALEVLKKKQHQDLSKRKWLIVFIIGGSIIFSGFAVKTLSKLICERNYIANPCSAPAEIPNQWYNGTYTNGIQKELSMSKPGTIHETLGDGFSPDSIRIRFEGKEGDRVRLISQDREISSGLADPSTQMTNWKDLLKS